MRHTPPYLMKLNPDFITSLMGAALEQAEMALGQNEVPVGAAIGYQDSILAVAANRMEQGVDASAHAEMLVMRQAAKQLGNWRLKDCVLCVTLEPCTMCAGAIRLSRVATVIYGASDPRAGAFGSLYDLSQDSRLGAPVRVIKGIEEERCSKVLKSFFTARRNQVPES